MEVIFVVLIFSFFLFLAAKIFPSAYSLSKNINLYDEGILLVGAKRIANGEIPYRDFWAIYTPLNYIGLSTAFKIFGESLLVERLYNVFVALIALLSIYYLFRKKTGYILATITCLFFLFFPSPLKLTHFFIFLTLISILALIKSEKNKLMPYIIGICVGLTFATRLDFGILTGMVAFVTTIILAKLDYKKFIYYNLKIFAGFLLAISPIVLWLIFNGALFPFIEQNIYYPFFGNFVAQRNLPIPSLMDPWKGIVGTISFGLNWWFWIFVIAFFTIALFLKKIKKEKTFLCVFGLLIIGSLPYLFQRSDSAHLVFVNILGLSFFYYVIFSFHKFKTKHFLISIVVPFLIFYFPLKSYFNEVATSEQNTRIYSFYSQPLVQNEENEDLESTVEYIINNIDASEPIYSGLPDHSKIFINNVFLYFLLPNEIPTMYHELHPGVANTEKVQMGIIDEIKDVKYVILWDYFHCEPNESCVSTEVRILDDYINNNYHVVENFGKYKILTRKTINGYETL